MPLMITVPGNIQLEGVTRNAILKRFLRETGLGIYGTATGGSTSTIDDTTRLKSSQLSANDWIGGWARIGKDAGGAGAAPENEHQPITTYDPTTNGRITFNPGVTAAVASGDEYQLWRYPNPTFVKDFLDQVLMNDVYLPYWTLLSEAPDFDMEASGTTSWSATNVTLSKITAATGNYDPINGKQSLKVAQTSPAGYASNSFTIQAVAGKRYHISVAAQGETQGLNPTLEVYNATGVTLLGSATSSVGFPIRLVVEVSATDNGLVVHLTHTSPGDSAYFDDLVVYCVDSTDIALPWWVKSKDQVRGIFELNPDQISTGVWDTSLRGALVNNNYKILDSPFGNAGLRLVKQDGNLNSPVFIFGIRNETAFANDNLDIKQVDENFLFTALAYRVFTHLKQLPTSGVLDSGWITRQALEYKGEYEKYLRAQSERIERIVQTTQPDGAYLDGRFVYGGM